ncbi:hypothetical protein BU23DRAFT_520477 [Bimuria novae-zelandiae CBS 107.79]|uniref:ABM domain-containing protein n=1 Tax=Bimuria novae-zelandiae CBS 107.79 TaxID=1447943 RepID=A0A6A5UKI2_9PLEO|nr:hypothetical protein BU23DRAFT_520477 [Bimuria novae-zelandiae CBS 107.79]
MSELVQLVALVTPNPGKVHQLEKLQVAHCKWVEANEPGTLRFAFYKEILGDGEACATPKFVLHEIYKDRAALDAHLSSVHMARVLQAVEKEQLWAEPIKTMYVKHAGGFLGREAPEP